MLHSFICRDKSRSKIQTMEGGLCFAKRAVAFHGERFLLPDDTTRHVQFESPVIYA